MGRPAPLRLVHARRHPPGGRGDGRDPRLPGVGGELLRPLPPRARGRAPGARLHQHQLLAARRRRCSRRSARPPGSTGRAPPRTASSSCAASSAWAPATWRRWPRSTSATTARSPRTTPPTAVEQLRSGAGGAAREAARRTAASPAGPRAPQPDRGRGADGLTQETRLLFRNIDEPGLASIDTYRKLGGYRSIEQGLQGDDARGGPEGARGLRPARPRRRRLLDGQEGLVPAPRRHGQVPLLQRRRVRAGRVQGPRADAEEPAPADRGIDHRRPRGRREPLLHLHPRRVRPPGRHPRAGGRGGIRGRLPRRGRARHRGAGGAGRPPRRRRLHLRRGDRAARLARGKAGEPAPQAALPGRPGPLRRADPDQQRRDALQRPAHRRLGGRVVQELRHRAVARDQGRLRLGRRQEARQLRGRARDPDPGPDRGPGGRAAGRQQDQGLLPRRLLVSRC